MENLKNGEGVVKGKLKKRSVVSQDHEKESLVQNEVDQTINEEEHRQSRSNSVTMKDQMELDYQHHSKKYNDKPNNVPDELKLFKAIRLVGVLLWILVFTILVWIIVPINIIFFDPLCRYLKVKPKNFSLERISRIWAKGILYFLNIKVVIEDHHNVGDYCDQPTVMMYNHLSYLDPVILQAYSPIPSKYIFKRELLYILPMVFVLASLVGHIPINRKKKNSAIDSINEAADVIVKYKKCVSVSPEGTRSETGFLQPFKKGPFHLALRSNATIVPVIHFGNQFLWPPTQFLPNSGTSYVRFLKPIHIPEGSDVDSLSELVREKMLSEFDKMPKNYVPFPSKPSAKHSFIFLLIMIPLIYYSTIYIRDNVYNILSTY